MAGTSFPAGDHLPGWIAAGIMVILFLLLPRLRSQPDMSSFPLLSGKLLGEKEYGSRSKRAEAFFTRPVEVYRKGYEHFKHQIYRLSTRDGDHLIIPECYLDELKQKSDDEIDVLRAFGDMLANDYTKLFPSQDRFEVAIHTVKVTLTRNLARMNPRLSAEVDKTVKSEFPACEDWTPLPINSIMLRIVAIVSGNIFLGPDLCRHEAYIDAALNFTVDTSAAAQDIKRWPAWFRSTAVRLGLCPKVKKAQSHRGRFNTLLKPIIAERRALMAEGRPVPDDMFQWVIEKAATQGVVNDLDLAQILLVLIFAAIHTTTVSVTALMYDLAMLPEVVEDIREEVTTVLKTTDGVMTGPGLFKMKLLDSAMRESQRFTPAFTDSFKRYVQKPITLKDGTEIPAGTFIDTPSLVTLHDPEHYTDPDTFDPYRFYNLRTKEGVLDPNNFKNKEQYQFVSVTKENTVFGFGKHACPGRFFAANEIKLVMANILLNFHLRLPPDVKERYPNIYAGSMTGPSPSGTVEFKRISRA